MSVRVVLGLAALVAVLLVSGASPAADNDTVVRICAGHVETYPGGSPPASLICPDGSVRIVR